MSRNISNKRKERLVEGTIQGSKGLKSFAFLIPDDKDMKDVFIAGNKLHGAMHNDRVKIKITLDNPSKRKLEGEVVEILERNTSKLVGIYQAANGFGFVVPDDNKYEDIHIQNPPKNIEDGDMVQVEIVKYVTGKRKSHEGKILEILGKPGDKGIDILAIAKNHGLPMEFPKKVIQFADEIPDEIDEKEIKRRLDLRNETIVTIDGDDAKDFDDAVSIKKNSKGNYILGVHIADVTHYVKEGNPLDLEAYNRATSVYLIDRVIPMLPFKLSNGLCSLNPKVDRLTLSCIMEIDKHGYVIDSQVKESVIKSTERMTYANVTKILERSDEEIVERYKDLIPMFELMQELCLILRNKRLRRGALDFDFPEAKIILDETGKPIDVFPYPRETSNRIIEEFMLIANETIAERYFYENIPFVYRIHENPDEEKMNKFKDYIAGLGYVLEYDEAGPGKKLQELLEKIKGTKEENAISTLLLRSLMQAKYSPECSGHFGLAAKFYCHFTSPIRRYPDLQIHRIIKEKINNKLNDTRKNKLINIVDGAARHSSERERQAEDAENEVEAMKKAEYMKDRIGEEFEGTISSVTEYAIFVTLPNTIEGCIGVANMANDEYSFDDKNKILIGVNSRKQFKLGESIKVRCIDANIDERTVFFEEVE